MSEFALYLDEDSHAIGLAEALRQAGMDVLRSTEAKMDGRSDADQLAFATGAQRVIYTANGGDYNRLHAAYLSEERRHAGIIIWSRKRRYDVGEQARRILRVWAELTAEDMASRVEFLGRWGERPGRLTNLRGCARSPRPQRPGRAAGPLPRWL